MKKLIIELHQDSTMYCVRIIKPDDPVEDIIRHADNFYNGFTMDGVHEDYNDVFEFMDALKEIYSDSGFRVIFNNRTAEDAWLYDPWAI